MRWMPAVSFERCYLSVYPGKSGKVYLTKEVYWLMGRPKRLIVWIMGNKFVLSPSIKYGFEVLFSTGGQPYIVCAEVSAIIGPGNRAYYSYDESGYDYDERYSSGKYRKRNRRYFYFRVRSSDPAAPSKKPMLPAIT